MSFGNEVIKCFVIVPISSFINSLELLKTYFSPDRSSAQIKFKRLRRQISAARRNVELLLRICIPDRLIWIRNGWDGRRIEEVLQHIITDQARQKLQQSINLINTSRQTDVGGAKEQYPNSR